jgi:hypothetical protein
MIFRQIYEGVIDTITLSDIRRESDFTEVDLRKIAETYFLKKSG